MLIMSTLIILLQLYTIYKLNKFSIQPVKKIYNTNGFDPQKYVDNKLAAACIADDLGNMLAYNDEAIALLGVSVKNLKRNGWFKYVNNEDRMRIYESWFDFCSGRSDNHEVQVYWNHPKRGRIIVHAKGLVNGKARYCILQDRTELTEVRK